MRTSLACMVIACVALAACESPTIEVPATTVLVRINATSEVQATMRALRLRVASNGGGAWAVEKTQSFAASDLRWPVDYPVTSTSAASAASLFELVAEALDADGQPLVQSRAITGFVVKQTRVLEMGLEACGKASDDRGLGFLCPNKTGCIGEACARCVNGECVATKPVDPARLDAFEPPSGGMNEGGNEPSADPDADAGAAEFAIAVYGKPCLEKGDKACEGRNSSQPLFCNANGTWDFGSACQGATRCQALAISEQVGTCQPIVSACTERRPGDLFCSANARRRCGADLLTEEPAPCGENASCIDGASDATCVCNDDHTGDPELGCAKFDCALIPCQNGGTCPDGIGARSCDCSLVDYSGLSCESKIDDCVTNPCQNGGVCTDGVRSRTCDCAAVDYGGASCESKIDDCVTNPCQNGGVCTDGVRSRTCDCAAVDYSGASCESKIDDCASNPCLNGGLCMDDSRSYVCDCSGTGYEGATCTSNVNECDGINVCTAVYPCSDLTPFYRCDGQLAEWNVSASNNFSASNGVVTDTLTGLQWQQTAEAYTNWDGARAHCGNLVLGGMSDWRLPTITELRSIVDYNAFRPAINTTAFPNAQSDMFWSISPYASSLGSAWLVNFRDGRSLGGDMNNNNFRARCVR